MKSNVSKKLGSASVAHLRPKSLGLPESVSIEAIVEAVAERTAEKVLLALDEKEEPVAPLTKPRLGMAKHIGVSLSTFDAMRRQGMPEIRVVDSPRWIVEDVMAWLRSQTKDGAQ